jgi:D-alanine transaminase
LNIVYLNGEFLPIEQASISVMDRGFLFADSVYEVIPVYAGRPFRLVQHLERLNRSLNAIRLSLSDLNIQWNDLFSELISQNSLQQGSLYLQVTRGSPSRRDHRLADETQPTVFIKADCLASNSSKTQNEPEALKVITVDDFRWQRCDIKSTGLLANCLARQMAEDQQASEAIFIAGEQVNEGSASNVFIVEQGVIKTPPLSNNILGGITRDLVLEMADNNGWPTEQSSILLEQLYHADEVWLTSSSREIQPVTQVDDKTIGDGAIGPLWHKIVHEFADFKQRLFSGDLR